MIAKYAESGNTELSAIPEGRRTCRIAKGETADDLRDGGENRIPFRKPPSLNILRFDLDECAQVTVIEFVGCSRFARQGCCCQHDRERKTKCESALSCCNPCPALIYRTAMVPVLVSNLNQLHSAYWYEF
jgi:hypothetical protein